MWPGLAAWVIVAGVVGVARVSVLVCFGIFVVTTAGLRMITAAFCNPSHTRHTPVTHPKPNRRALPTHPPPIGHPRVTHELLTRHTAETHAALNSNTAATHNQLGYP